MDHSIPQNASKWDKFARSQEFPEFGFTTLPRFFICLKIKAGGVFFLYSCRGAWLRWPPSRRRRFGHTWMQRGVDSSPFHRVPDNCIGSVMQSIVGHASCEPTYTEIPTLGRKFQDNLKRS